MKRDRRSGGFTRVGEAGVDGLGLGAREARKLRMADAWRRVTGEALAGRVRAVGLQRGVLELEAEPRWARVVKPMLPRVVGWLAWRFPELGVRRFRLHETGETTRPKSEPVVAEAPPATAGAGEEGPRTVPAAPPEAPDAGDRLERVARRYLERARELRKSRAR